MIWARLAVQLEGARIGHFPIAACQDRTGSGGSSFKGDKLLDDARGSALVRAFDVLIAERVAFSDQSISIAVAERGALLFSVQLAERLDTIARSEQRACMLLDEIREFASSCLRDVAWGAYRPQFIRNIDALHTALRGDSISTFVAADALEVRRYFVDLYQNVQAYRVQSIDSHGKNGATNLGKMATRDWLYERRYDVGDNNER